MNTRDGAGRRRARIEALALAAVLVGSPLVACGQGGGTLALGAVFPLHGPQAPLATQELLGARLAADLVNRQGGVAGKRISLVVRDLETRQGAATAVGSLERAGVPAVLGAYSFQLSIPAAAATSRAGLVYWEAGAVADQVTGQGSPLVFRVGASG
ncbi:MAG: ABC transporter substrate-binding protein, partial [Acidimicrobiales bacterium]